MRATTRIASIGVISLMLPAMGFGQWALLLKGTSRCQVVQNSYADRHDLSRMTDSRMVARFSRNGYLVRVPASARHYYLASIPADYRYLRPWSKLLLDRLSRQYYARFHKRLRVTSAVRTVRYQRALAKRNVNAAAAHGARRSSHLTGATLDISKRGMSRAELNWMRRVLHSLRKQGYLYAVEEFRQPTFHIMVYRDYERYVKSRVKLAARR
jgi:hypothetical protein